jgi:DNA-binding LytR/AlgR family response regulator
MKATALIAEDEPLLAAALATELQTAWPDLHIVATVGDGASAVRAALALKPQVLFFDIRMPGQSGLDAAVELADAWPPHTEAGAPPFPALVFVSAYDQYAVQAFEAQAIDYVLKPVQAARLQKTVLKVQQILIRQAQAAINSIASISPDFETTLVQLRALMHAGAAVKTAPLTVIQASVGSSIRMVPVDDIVYFEAADKYLRVLTADHEYLIRTALKDLLPQLDSNVFWQIHRGTVVRAGSIEAINRDEAGKLWLVLRGRAEKISVSRVYAHLFKAM